MATTRLFSYNPQPGHTISGTEQVGDIAAATGSVNIQPETEWWNGPDEDLGYVVCYVDPTGNRPNATERIFGGNIPCHIGFKRSTQKTDESFLNLAKKITGSQSLDSASSAKTLLNNNGYWTSYVVAASLLLDTYSGAAAAYSLRKLSSTYNGSAIRVRRSSDNTEQDIGFDGNGELDQSALTSFVGAGNGYVVTWYDQSGNGNNIIQTLAASQPRVVNSSNVDKMNNLPTVYFNQSFLSSSNFMSSATAATYFAFTALDSDPPTSAGGAGGIICTLIQSGQATHNPWVDGTIYEAFGTNARKTVGNPSNSLATPYLYCVKSVTDDYKVYINNAQFYSTGSNTVSFTSNILVGKSTSHADFFYTGRISELLIYSTSPDINGISSDINIKYSIY